MLVKIAKEISVNPKHVTFVGTIDSRDKDAVKQHNTVVFLVGCPSGIQSDHDFETTTKMLDV